MKIRYYASAATMGDTSAVDCEKYLEWAKDIIETEYPDHEVEVSGGPSLSTAFTDDEENRNEIIDFCSRLWDNCPWNWEQ